MTGWLLLAANAWMWLTLGSIGREWDAGVRPFDKVRVVVWDEAAMRSR
jgi:hypothetical protein